MIREYSLSGSCTSFLRRDDNSVYLTWIPEKLWYTAVLVAGIVQGILLHSGLKCSVVSHSHLENEKT